MEFITKYSESVKIGTKEYNNKPDMCEPDNSMSIPEIIAKFSRGQGIQVSQHPWQAGSASEPDGYNPQDLDNFFDEPAKEPAQEPVQEPAQEPAPEQAQSAPAPAGA